MSSAVPWVIQCSSGRSHGSWMSTTKLVEWPVVDSTPGGGHGASQLSRDGGTGGGATKVLNLKRWVVTNLKLLLRKSSVVKLFCLFKTVSRCVP